MFYSSPRTLRLQYDFLIRFSKKIKNIFFFSEQEHEVLHASSPWKSADSNKKVEVGVINCDIIHQTSMKSFTPSLAMQAEARERVLAIRKAAQEREGRRIKDTAKPFTYNHSILIPTISNGFTEQRALKNEVAVNQLDEPRLTSQPKHSSPVTSALIDSLDQTFLVSTPPSLTPVFSATRPATGELAELLARARKRPDAKHLSTIARLVSRINPHVSFHEAVKCAPLLTAREKLDLLRAADLRRTSAANSRRRQRTSMGRPRYRSKIFERSYFFSEDDLEEHFTRGRGPGGQATNRRSQTCELKHIPTGIIIRASKDRSLYTNRKRARDQLNKMLEDLIKHGVEDKQGRKLSKDNQKYLSKEFNNFLALENNPIDLLNLWRGESSFPPPVLDFLRSYALKNEIYTYPRGVSDVLAMSSSDLWTWICDVFEAHWNRQGDGPQRTNIFGWEFGATARVPAPLALLFPAAVHYRPPPPTLTPPLSLTDLALRHAPRRTQTSIYSKDKHASVDVMRNDFESENGSEMTLYLRLTDAHKQIGNLVKDDTCVQRRQQLLELALGMFDLTISHVSDGQRASVSGGRGGGGSSQSNIVFKFASQVQICTPTGWNGSRLQALPGLAGSGEGGNGTAIVVINLIIRSLMSSGFVEEAGAILRFIEHQALQQNVWAEQIIRERERIC